MAATAPLLVVLVLVSLLEVVVALDGALDVLSVAVLVVDDLLAVVLLERRLVVVELVVDVVVDVVPAKKKVKAVSSFCEPLVVALEFRRDCYGHHGPSLPTQVCQGFQFIATGCPLSGACPTRGGHQSYLKPPAWHAWLL